MQVLGLPSRAALAVTLATAAAASAAPAAIAQAPDPTVKLRSAGDTRLTLSSRAAESLAQLGVRVAPLGSSSVRSGAVRFPITGGAIDPATAAGVIRHSGGIELAKGHTEVRLRNLRIRGRTLSAAVGGSRVRLMTLDLDRAKVTRPGAGGPLRSATRVRNVKVLLNRTGARALNRAFHTTAFKGGLLLGRATVTARPGQALVEEGTTRLTLDAATAGTLTGALGLGLGVVAPAAPQGDAIAFPITPSKISTRLTSGTIRHTGGLSLDKASTSLSLTDFDIRLGSSTLYASVNGTSPKARIVSLDLSDARTAARGRTLTISGVKASLTGVASDALTGTFDAPDTEGAPLGTVVVTANLR